MILTLRFGSSQRPDTRYRILTYRRIAGLIKMSNTYVRKVCLEHVEKMKELGGTHKIRTRSKMQ